MSRKLILASMFPSLLNAYGDQGNLLALKQQLHWFGLDSENLLLEPGMQPDEVADPDFLLIGSGFPSQAIPVVQELQQWNTWLQRQRDRDVPILAVGLGWVVLCQHLSGTEPESLYGLGLTDHEVDYRPHVAGDVLWSVDGMEVQGFLNTVWQVKLGPEKKTGHLVGSSTTMQDVIPFITEGNRIYTLMHGPILPRNPALFQGLITTIVERAGMRLKNNPDQRSLAAHRLAEMANESDRKMYFKTR